MFVYRNANTGDEVRRAERSVRLDHLANWSLISAPAPAPEMPVRSASKADWKAYAIARGMAEADAEKATRDQLAEHFHGPAE
jgi:hypothetical protein